MTYVVITMDGQFKLSIIILSWNTCDLTRQCLRSVFDTWGGVNNALSQNHEVLKQVQHPNGYLRYDNNNDLEVIVSDNASTDNSVAMIQQEFPQVKLICNQENLGFAKGNNVALKQAQGKYVLFLNSDTIIQDNALREMVRVAEKDERIGGMGPRLLNEDGSDQWQFHRKFPTLGQIFWVYTTILGRITPRISWLRKKYLGEQDRIKSSKTKLQLSGACLMMPTRLAKKLNGFDENFYFWLEDVDLCWRIKKTGHILYYNADAKIIHLGGASSAQWSNFKRVYNFRLSMLKYFRKYRSKQAKFVRLIFQIDALVMIPLSLLVKPSRVKVYWKFLKEFYY